MLFFEKQRAERAAEAAAEKNSLSAVDIFIYFPLGLAFVTAIKALKLGAVAAVIAVIGFAHAEVLNDFQLIYVFSDFPLVELLNYINSGLGDTMIGYIVESKIINLNEISSATTVVAAAVYLAIFHINWVGTIIMNSFRELVVAIADS